MIKLVKNEHFGILISTEKLDEYPMILEYTNLYPKNNIYENWNNMSIKGVDTFIFNHNSDGVDFECPIFKYGVDRCDSLLDIYADDDYIIRYRNYCENPIVFQHRHPRNSLRSIINYTEMFDQKKLWWYYITLDEYTILNRSIVVTELVS